MTLQQIKDNLIANFFKVGEPSFIKTFDPEVKLYSIPVIEKEGDIMWENNIHICQNGEIDDYYWKNGEPKPASVAFRKEVNVYIKQKITDGTIEGIKSLAYDTLSNRAYATVVKNNVGTLNEIKVWIDKDASGNLRHRIVV